MKYFIYIFLFREISKYFKKIGFMRFYKVDPNELSPIKQLGKPGGITDPGKTWIQEFPWIYATGIADFLLTLLCLRAKRGFGYHYMVRSKFFPEKFGEVHELIWANSKIKQCSI